MSRYNFFHSSLSPFPPLLNSLIPFILHGKGMPTIWLVTVLGPTIKQSPCLRRAHRLLGEKGMLAELVLTSPLIILSG